MPRAIAHGTAMAEADVTGGGSPAPAEARKARTPRTPSPAAQVVLPPELGDAVGFRIRRALATADVLFSEAFGAFDVNAAQYALLMVVRHNPGCQTSAAASLLGVTPNNAVPLIDSLVARGYIRRTLSTTDRRVRNLRLTRSGQELCVRLTERHEMVRAAVEARLGAADAAELLRLLIRYGA